MQKASRSIYPRLNRKEMPEGFLRIAPELGALTQLNPARTILSIVFTWMIIIGAMGAWYAIDSWWAYVPVVLIIGSRQHALAVLAHEGVHGLIMENRKWNRRIAAWFCAWPMGFNYEDYTFVHLTHHRYVNDEKRDPDWKHFEKWHDLPKSKGWMLRYFAKYLLGWGVIEAFAFKIYMHKENPNRKAISGDQLILLFIALTLAMGLIGGYWEPAIGVFLLWIVPLHFVFYPVNLYRAMAEHYGFDRKDNANSTARMFQCRTIQGHFLERFWISPFNINYHLEHHLLDTVPYYHLPAASELLKTIPETNTPEQRRARYFGREGVLGQLTREEKKAG
jgi:fatty acid desaturase